MDVACLPANLSRISALGCGGSYEKAYFPQNTAELKQIIERHSTDEINIFGAASNTLVVGEQNSVAVFSDLFKGISAQGERITAYAGEPLSKVCGTAQYFALGGMENLCGIPGTVGGAVIGNSGAFGTSVGDILESVTVYKLDTGETEVLTRGEIAFGYRYSNLRRDKDFVVSATFALYSDDAERMARRSADVRRRRRASQPCGKSLGCVFKQYRGVSAGYYIEQAGLKGFSQGGMTISPVHANFIVNDGNGTAEEYLGVLKKAESEVEKQLGIKLEREVNIVGEEKRQ
jgi:UDP-N-acetylmuramate dehydrogenase